MGQRPIEGLPGGPGDLASQVRQARLDHGWSQGELAEHAGVSRPTVARIEGGRDVSMRMLTMVASALGLRLALVAAE